ncbi:alpha/beta fold hydrolase [Acetanaerobacterium elongatum]|uniref:Pimeloyl-ACP methyl ester carboxylesterase n=1 Tax=Acetanaerobacterium elongatum TaxID=258515 RepID=A0A1H0CXM0_9FIRM|nr:alpha/beta hydrolase [Acetanaerobacterium elongatum]SDN62660.1 Pimeloyl-ACP methyl ester carboxylesterase [Acetanaerobacterium elongatum]
MSYFIYKEKACYYEEYGNGTPLLLLHGNTASSKMFQDAIEPLATDFKVVLLDFLGHGKSERVDELAADLWFDEALQVIALLEQKHYKNVNLIGSSGGAIVAINVALERPDLVHKVIADSFEGKAPLKELVENIAEERRLSKQDGNGKAFYRAMHGEDWEGVVDNDTAAILRHAKNIGSFYHKPLSKLHIPILFTGCKEDEYAKLIDPNFYEKTFASLIKEIGSGELHIFEGGRHPAMLGCKEEFIMKAKDFLLN